MHTRGVLFPASHLCSEQGVFCEFQTTGFAISSKKEIKVSRIRYLPLHKPGKFSWMKCPAWEQLLVSVRSKTLKDRRQHTENLQTVRDPTGEAWTEWTERPSAPAPEAQLFKILPPAILGVGERRGKSFWKFERVSREKTTTTTIPLEI